MFQKREKVYEDLIDFSRHNVSTGMVNAYIIKILYEIEGFSEIGYRVENLPSGQRFVLYTYYGAHSNVKQYFRDRCPGMIEEKVRSMKEEQMRCSWQKRPNGFEYVIPYKE